MVPFAPVNMSSIPNYFAKADKDTSSNVVIPTSKVPGISDKEILKITDQILSNSDVKRINENNKDE